MLFSSWTLGTRHGVRKLHEFRERNQKGRVRSYGTRGHAHEGKRAVLEQVRVPVHRDAFGANNEDVLALFARLCIHPCALEETDCTQRDYKGKV